jgi:hypothetical protein
MREAAHFSIFSEMHPFLQEPAIRAILSQPFGRFSDAEFSRRRRALAEVVREHRCDALLVCGEERVGTGVGWLTGWPTSAEAMVLFAPGERDVLWVEHVNHVPNARTLAPEAEVRWAGRLGAQLAVEELTRRGAKRVGVMGLLSWRKQRQLAASCELVDLNRSTSGSGCASPTKRSCGCASARRSAISAWQPCSTKANRE